MLNQAEIDQVHSLLTAADRPEFWGRATPVSSISVLNVQSRKGAHVGR
jgi:hypothetical protein